MNCVICDKNILDNSHYINGKYYHNECIENLPKENQTLKDKVQDLQADYGTQTQIERDMLRQENKELKKQLNEYIASDLKLKNELYRKRKEYQETYKDVRIEIKEYKTQQKEFISWLEEEIERIKTTDIWDSFKKAALVTLQQVLLKYKEIVNASERN